jgi:hypothetical protein
MKKQQGNADWQAELVEWASPLLEALGHKARLRWASILIGECFDLGQHRL